MPKPLLPAGAGLLAASLAAVLLAWSNPASAVVLAPALASIAAQDEEEDDLEADEAQAEEEFAEDEDVMQEEDLQEEDEDLVQEEDDPEDVLEEDDPEDVLEEDVPEDVLEEDVLDEEDMPEEGVPDDADAMADEEQESDEDALSQDAAGELDEDPEADDAGAMEAADAEEDMIFEDDYADDAWASGWDLEEADETDDAIPIDHARFGNEEVWQVVEEDEDDDAGDDGDFVGGNIPSIRTSKPTPGKPGSKPPRRPGDDEDTVYSFGGLPVAAMQVPWQAQILYPAAPPQANDKRPAWQRQHYCGGALIAPDWVLTAAHCLNQQAVDAGFKVRLGVQDISKGDGVLYRIDRIVRHSQYNNESNDVNHPPNMYANDIALVHIVPDGRPVPIDSRRIRQIPINRKPLQNAVPVSATGWGVTGSSESANTMNAVLLRVDLQAMPNAVCQQRPGYGPLKIKDGVFCASNPARSTCRGDSGGPVVLTNQAPLLVGLVSWGKKACAGDGRPGVYTRIDRYAQWIDQAMKLPPTRNSLP